MALCVWKLYLKKLFRPHFLFLFWPSLITILTSSWMKMGKTLRMRDVSFSSKITTKAHWFLNKRRNWRWWWRYNLIQWIGLTLLEQNEISLCYERISLILINGFRHLSSLLETFASSKFGQLTPLVDASPSSFYGFNPF